LLVETAAKLEQKDGSFDGSVLIAELERLKKK
jgi:hypothetical protein